MVHRLLVSRYLDARWYYQLLKQTVVNGDSEDVPQNDVLNSHGQPFRSMKQRLVAPPILAVHRPKLWMR